MVEFGLRPWEANRLTWPQLKLVLGVDEREAEGTRLPRGGTQAVARDRRAELFARMAQAKGVPVAELVNLPIDELESLCRQVDPKVVNVNRLKMRVALLNHIKELPQQR